MRIFPFSSVRSVLFVLVVMASAGASFGQVAISVTIAPPPLPVYEQPLCPGEDYIWIPGYWAWDLVDVDYYWVPGTWVLPPEVGLLWTQPYWAWVNTGFVFYDEAGSGPSAPGALGCQCSENARIRTEAPATNHPTSAKTQHDCINK